LHVAVLGSRGCCGELGRLQIHETIAGGLPGRRHDGKHWRLLLLLLLLLLLELLPVNQLLFLQLLLLRRWLLLLRGLELRLYPLLLPLLLVVSLLLLLLLLIAVLVSVVVAPLEELALSFRGGFFHLHLSVASLACWYLHTRCK